MASISASYDKLILGAALVIALLLGALIYLNIGKLEKDFEVSGGGRNPVPVMEHVKEFEAQAAKVGVPVTLPAPVDGKGRTINNFVGIPWFLKRSSEEPIDLGDESNPPVHAGIPNKWWLEHRIDPGYADSPERDPDGDGFGNFEEYNAQTDPNDKNSFPSLIGKLECARVEKKLYRLSYTSDTTSGAIKEGDTFRFRHEEIVGRQKVTTNSDWIEPGKGKASTFFPKGGAQLRFELKEVKRIEEINPRTKAPETNNYAFIEDLSPSKKGDILKIEKGSSNGQTLTDYTAVLFLNAIGEASKEFKVPERSSFSLPFDPDAAVKPYTFTGMTPAGEVLIEWEEGGEKKSRALIPNAQP